MYTQCPECATAFRVTADILKQAGGKVRCGGCSIAFNALAYLSETKPDSPPPDDVSDKLPELKPDPVEVAGNEEPPLAISDEQSEELLKTLDELAGEDIRLEDTGIEWRLLSDDDDDEVESDSEGSQDALQALQLSDDIDTPIDAELSADVGDASIDEHLDNSPTHVDEILTDAPNDVDAAEVFDNLEDQVDSVGDSSDEHLAIELRFDDDTGLPDGEASDDASSFTDTAMPHEFEPVAQFIEPNEHIETQVDIVFGEPDEWGELLDEVAVADAALSASDDDSQTDGDDDNAAEAFAAFSDDLADDDAADDDDSVTADDAVAADEDDKDDSLEDAVGEETVLSVEDELESLDDEPDPVDAGIDDEFDVLDDEPELVDESIADDFDALDSDLDLISDELDALDNQLSAGDEEIAEDDDDDLSDQILNELKDGMPMDETPDVPELAMLPETEEEQTINRMIDQDMLRLAIEDEDGAASTMLLQEDGADTEGKISQTGIDIPGFPSEVSGVETIIMEGEFVRTALEQEALEAEAARGIKPDVKTFIDTAKQTFRGKMKQLEEVDENEPKTRYRMAVGIGLLALLLAGQVVHQTRADLVTIPALNSVITPIYRAIGLPITPDWDVTGWRFEVTRGNTSGGETVADPAIVDPSSAAPTASTAAEVLTIISRVGNKSSKPLPYPLISVALTDRFEETIGSKVLTPSEYLGAGVDASRLVPPGTNFNAVIPIETPSGAATGFKLNVCYRQTGGDLRCAVEDFK